MRAFTRFQAGLLAIHLLLPLYGIGEETVDTDGNAETADLAGLRGRAEAGHAGAQFDLGWRYQNGHGVVQNDVEAVKWYRLAAEQGAASAQSNLGMMLIEGRGAPQDRAEALHWFHEAAGQDHQMACYNLGLAYSHGDGVPRDPAVALDWFLKAARSRDEVAESEKGGYYQARDYVPWPLRHGSGAVEQGLPAAQHAIGAMYEKGVDVTQDYGEASQWYRKAADQGYARAQSNLANLYRTGRGVPQELPTALDLYLRAANQGDTLALNHLGGLYALGLGVPKDPVQSCRWFTLSAAAGSERGERNRDATMKRLTPEQIAECRRLVQEWNEARQHRAAEPAPSGIGPED